MVLVWFSGRRGQSLGPAPRNVNCGSETTHPCLLKQNIAPDPRPGDGHENHKKSRGLGVKLENRWGSGPRGRTPGLTSYPSTFAAVTCAAAGEGGLVGGGPGGGACVRPLAPGPCAGGGHGADAFPGGGGAGYGPQLQGACPCAPVGGAAPTAPKGGGVGGGGGGGPGGAVWPETIASGACTVAPPEHGGGAWCRRLLLRWRRWDRPTAPVNQPSRRCVRRCSGRRQRWWRERRRPRWDCQCRCTRAWARHRLSAAPCLAGPRYVFCSRTPS